MTNTNSRLGAHIPLIYHFAMLQDKQRMEGFREAINLTVPLGGKVLELGGGTGVLSYFAAQRASKVYCVERIPENAAAAKANLALNENGGRVEVICADAMEYLPPEPVDVVICEMLHVGMVREQQIEVIESFKERYRSKFGDALPRFVPEAFIQGIQPVCYDFTFTGYYAPVPLFQAPGYESAACKELAPPAPYQIAEYCSELPRRVTWDGTLSVNQSGVCNAVRIILKNFLAIVPAQNKTVSWHNQYLVLPLESPLSVSAGSQLSVSLDYACGCEVEELQNSVTVAHIEKMKRLAELIECSTTATTNLEREVPETVEHPSLAHQSLQDMRQQK